MIVPKRKLRKQGGVHKHNKGSEKEKETKKKKTEHNFRVKCQRDVPGEPV